MGIDEKIHKYESKKADLTAAVREKAPEYLIAHIKLGQNTTDFTPEEFFENENYQTLIQQAPDMLMIDAKHLGIDTGKKMSLHAFYQKEEDRAFVSDYQNEGAVRYLHYVLRGIN